MKQTQMNNFIDRDVNLLALHSEWQDDSYMRVRVRNYGKGSTRILVDITEMTGHRTSKARARKLACVMAEKFNVSSPGSLIRDDEIERKASRLDGSKVIVRIRTTCFAFDSSQPGWINKKLEGSDS